MANGGTFAGPMESDTASYDSGGFGSGLSFGGADSGGDGGAPPQAPRQAFAQGDNMPPAPDATLQGLPQQPPAAQSPSFGEGLRSILPGPHYRAPDPAATALDQTADTLTQRIQRANAIAANPIAQFFNPEAAQKARDFVPAATEQLQKIRQQQASMQANRTQAATLGLAPGETPDEASQADRVQAAVNGALKGDLAKFKGLQIVDPKTAEVIAPQVMETVGVHLTNAQLAFDSLAGMQNQGQYTAKLDQLRRDGTLSDLEALGLKVPPGYDVFNAGKGAEGKTLRDARQSLNDARNKLEARITAQPMEETEAKTYKTAWKTAYGDEITGQPSRIAATGARGNIIDGYDDPRKLGKPGGAVLATPEQRKSIKEDAELAVPKEDLEKLRGNNRTYQLATTDSKGEKIPSEGKLDSKGNRIYINDNPNVQQGIAEGLASALRGGSGGANVGLLKIETSKRGYIQGLLDTMRTNIGGGLNTVSGEQVRPYLTTLTQKQQRDVLDFLKGYNEGDIPDRLAQTARRAGALGLDATALGFGSKEAAGSINDAVEEGRQAQVALDMKRHMPVGGGRGMLLYGALTPTATEPTTPIPGTTPATVTPNASNPTPVQANSGPQAPPPGAPAGNGGTPPAGRPGAALVPAGPSGPAGGRPGPVTIAGQSVSAPMPPGASPDYLAKMQRIESGGERDPWTSGTKGSSASGAFQFINSTWAANKPPGAPDRASQATPDQQAQAAAAFTAKNAQALAAARLPVNDTTLYIAHNLGTAGGPALLSASPTEDARTVVGEKAAANNPRFFKGKPTVATVLQRYQDAMNEAPDDSGPKPKPFSPTALAHEGATQDQRTGLMTRISRLLSQGVPADQRDRAVADVGNAAVEHAPAIGSTAGAVIGSAAGPVGSVAGGAAGGGAGQSLKDYVQGRDQNPTKIASQAALGGVLGVASAARPVVAAAARVAGAGAVEGATKAAEGGDTADIIEAAGTGSAYALGGEALGRFVSSAGATAFKALSRYTTPAKAELSAQAGKLAEARATLATEQPQTGAGPAAVANPKYEAAKKAEESATQAIKDHGQNPDDMVHAYEQAKAGTSSGEAMTMRGANAEKTDVGKGYEQLRKDVNEAQPGAKVKANQAVPDGPVAQIRTPENPTGKVPEAFRADAEHAEMLVTAPAKNWGEKWTQLQDAGSELVKKRMDFVAAGDKSSAKAMDDIFQGVRNQQKAAAGYLFGEKRGAEVIAHLEGLDKRYAKIMTATAGMNYQKMEQIIQGPNTPARRELETNFKEFAKDDPSAIRAFNAIKAGRNGRMSEEAGLMLPIIATEGAANLGGIPSLGVVSAAIAGGKVYSMLKDYMNAKILGKPVTFKDFFGAHIKATFAGDAARTATQAGALMQ